MLERPAGTSTSALSLAPYESVIQLRRHPVHSRWPMQVRRAVPYVLLLVLPTLVGAQTPTIGPITKTETNPYFAMMKKGAELAAKANGARLLSGAGKTDGDNAG